MTEIHDEIVDHIKRSTSVMITSHIRPDGDAIGSSLAFALAMKSMSKKIQVVLSDGVPENFRFLPGNELVVNNSLFSSDLIVCLDCSDIRRVGEAMQGLRSPDIVIDHHVTTENFGRINLIEPDAVATASVLYRHWKRWGLPMNTTIASNLITGIVTDTLGFRTSNTSPEALRQAADLMEYGADLGNLYYRSLVRRTFVEAKYWGAGLSSLERADGIVWATLSNKARKDSGYSGKDDSDLINIVSSIDDAQIAIMFVEQDANKTKISWRGLKPGVDVAKISKQFHGGGHKAAAGAEVDGSLEEVKNIVLTTTKQALNGTSNKSIKK